MATIKSIEEKARRYDKALERANKLKETCDSNAVVGWMEYIFPELKESGDIRKRIIDALHGDVLEMGEIKKAIAWLEKQGNLMKALQISNARIGELIEKNYYLKEQLEKQGELKKHDVCDNCEQQGSCVSPCPMKLVEKQGEQNPVIKMKTPEESLGIDSDTYNKIVDECVYGEQKPTDKVEPKFHEGEWLVNIEYGNVVMVLEVLEDNYRLDFGGDTIGTLCTELVDNDYRLWTIQDAKDGDVLVSESTCGLGTWYCIFKSLDGDESMTVYCYLTRDGRFETKKELCFDKDPYNTKPATKEQIDTLMKVMADAGYTFDFDKKELKKIEQKPAWGEEDIELLDNTIKFIEDRVAATSPSLRTYSPTLTGKEIPFLKSLKERYTWKPTMEQLTVLSKAIELRPLCESDGTILMSLYYDLKKLMEE